MPGKSDNPTGGLAPVLLHHIFHRLSWLEEQEQEEGSDFLCLSLLHFPRGWGCSCGLRADCSSDNMLSQRAEAQQP